MLSNHSIFCRENALKALYNLGDADAVAEAVEKLSADAHLHNEKLLSDGMNSFRGDRAKLAEALMERFERYDDHSQSAIITFFTVAGFHDWDAFFKERLAREEISIDQRCDILRLLMKVPSADTKRILIDTLREKGKAEDWQTAAVAATGLACYPDDAETVEALRYGITSPAWSVRKNCAAALVKLRAPREVLDGILCGEDAYARDALRFALDQREDQTEGEKE
jgi:HEAT repeat protein